MFDAIKARLFGHLNSEATQKRAPGEVSETTGHWVVVDESQQVKSGYKHQCGTELKGKVVYLTIRDGLFPLSGSGEVKNQTVPFCPKCEREPEGHGFISSRGTIVVN